MRIAILLLLFCSVFSTEGQTKLSNQGKLLLHPEAAALKTDTGSMQVLAASADCRCDSVLEAGGIRITGRYGNILSMSLPASKWQFLLESPCISYVEPSTRANAARVKNDTERQFSSVDKVHQGLSNGLQANYKGKGVVVGIVDIGFQCGHPTFYTEDGSSLRVSRVWMQNGTALPGPPAFGYGSEYSNPAVIKLLNDMDGSHGTHVAGIAGGSGHNSPGLRYAGMAPESELVFVSLKYANDTLGGSALGDYIVANPSILDAYRYIFDYAASVGKPAVINLSWGMHTGPHDGSSLFDLATESLTGKGKILVGANGNDGENPMHIAHTFSGDTIGSIMIENGRQWRSGESVYGDFWGSAGSSFSLKIRFIDTLKNTIAETPYFSSLTDTALSFRFNADSQVFKVVMASQASNPLNGKPNITVMAEHRNQRKYAIVLYMTSASSAVHGWNSGAARGWTSGSFRNLLNRINYEGEFLYGNSDYTAGENGGTSKAVISVGALAARSAYINHSGKLINDSAYVLPGRLAPFSSRGPTVDGRIKPDISAPGYDVPSSVNNRQFEGWMNDKTVLKSVFNNDTQYWSCFNGTSMAAPHVTGIVALLLQVNPQLNPDQLREILSASATVDAATGTVPNNAYGHGKVNAYNAILETLKLSSLSLQNTGPGLLAGPNPFQDHLQLLLPETGPDAHISISSMDGRCIYNRSGLQPGPLDIYFENTISGSGIYILRFVNKGEIFILKLLKN